MPPKKATSVGAAPRGRPAGAKNKADKPAASAKAKPASAKAKGKQRAVSPDDDDDDQQMDLDGREEIQIDDHDHDQDQDDDDDEDEDEHDREKTIPPDLLTRILAEFFEKDGTRITRDANTAVAKYMDIFVKEAIARAAAERGGGFLEVRLSSLLLLRCLDGFGLTFCGACTGRGSRKDSPPAPFRSLTPPPFRSRGPTTSKPPPVSEHTLQAEFRRRGASTIDHNTLCQQQCHNEKILRLR